MSLRFLDGFDHYATANVLSKWTWNQGAISAGNGRFGGASLRFNSNGVNTNRTIDAQPTWIVGFAYRTSYFYSPNMPFFRLLDNGSPQVDLYVSVDGSLFVTRNGVAVTGGTSTKYLVPNTYNYIEYKVTITNSIAANSWQVRVNGDTWINVPAGQSSKATVNATANQIMFGMLFQGGPVSDYDDLYVCDGQGSKNNDFLGDLKVVTVFPTGAGTNTQWTPSAGANFSCVDEVTPTDDTDFVSSSTPNQIDTYTVGDIVDTPSTIFGVQTNLYARKDDVSARTLAKVIRSGTTDFAGSNKTMTTSYAYYLDIDENDPNTAAAWTKTGFNSAEFGVKEIA